MDHVHAHQNPRTAPEAVADMLRVIAIRHPDDPQGPLVPTRPTLGLAHDDRHLRRRVLTLPDGARALIDLPAPTVLNAGDVLSLSDGSAVAIEAAPEPLYEVRAGGPVQLTGLAWHIGNRHLACAIEADRLFILRDPVIRNMLEGLGARVAEVSAPFAPLRGAYAAASRDHGHSHP